MELSVGGEVLFEISLDHPLRLRFILLLPLIASFRSHYLKDVLRSPHRSALVSEPC